MKKFLFWDFDGVLFNSIDECLISSYNAYQLYKYNNNSLVSSLNKIPENYQAFYYKHRKYVRPAGEYFIIHYAYENHIRLDDYDTFSKIIQDSGSIISEFQKLVFEKRNELKTVDIKKWLALHHPYQNVVNVWKSLSKYYVHYIVSNKDKNSIISLMDDFHMDINPDKVFGGDFSSNKLEIINYILETYKVRAEEAYFIDDNYYHLNDVAETGIHLIFADWGYGDPPVHFSSQIMKLSLSDLPQALINQ
ncbi:MAG: HAD hydrolase-like protein [bacterium]|nr:HAD hydrolase-like protein [bacterium]